MKSTLKTILVSVLVSVVTTLCVVWAVAAQADDYRDYGPWLNAETGFSGVFNNQGHIDGLRRDFWYTGDRDGVISATYVGTVAGRYETGERDTGTVTLNFDTSKVQDALTATVDGIRGFQNQTLRGGWWTYDFMGNAFWGAAAGGSLFMTGDFIRDGDAAIGYVTSRRQGFDRFQGVFGARPDPSD